MSPALMLLVAILAFAAGHYSGWISAHVTVARECERLGGFFVGQRVFECRARPDVKSTEQRP